MLQQPRIEARPPTPPPKDIFAPASPEVDSAHLEYVDTEWPPTYDEPLYTEIRIPLPPLPKPKASPTSPKGRNRAHTLASISPFHRRSSSASSSGKDVEEWPRIKKEVKNKEIAAMMNLSHRNKRSGTIDALAVVPAVLVLSAELFTPTDSGQKKKKEKGLNRWQDSLR